MKNTVYFPLGDPREPFIKGGIVVGPTFEEWGAPEIINKVYVTFTENETVIRAEIGGKHYRVYPVDGYKIPENGQIGFQVENWTVTHIITNNGKIPAYMVEE